MSKKLKTKNEDEFKILNILAICIIVVMALNLMTSKSDKLFKLIGFRTYTVLSGSMEPKFYPGDLVVTQHKDKANIKINDIVTFKNEEGAIITHRIISQTNEGYITKGDNNNVEDAGNLKEDSIIGKVKFSIPKVGYIISYLSNPKMVAIEMVLLAVFIFFYYRD